MPERSSSSGVQGLRAMFEKSNETTSPPSRGRSPAGSVTSEGQRPYSKVRTSFISVDRNDQLGYTPEKMNNSEGNVEGDGSNQTNAATGGSSAEGPKLNGNTTNPSTNGNSDESVTQNNAEIPKEVENLASSSSENKSPSESVPAANPDKPVTGAEEEPAGMSPADPKEETAVTGGSEPETNVPDLGSVLKGSPFGAATDTPNGASESKKNSIQKDDVQKDEIPVENTTPSKAPKKAANINGLPKELGKSTKASPKPATSSTDTKKPSRISSTLKTPQTDGPTDTTSADKVKRVAAAKAATVEPAKQNPTRSNAGPSKKAGPTSPLNKPRPKSPTRPVRLPASATAPTAASAAKLGGAAPSRSPSRASTASKPSGSSKSRPTPLSSATAQSRQKPARTSLPQKSGAIQKPSPRTSMASAKGTDGGFLARMMRPTESSRSKTHEKVEVKSPPRKGGKTMWPKRKSGVTEESEDDKEKESVGAQNDETGKAQEQQQTDSKDTVTAKEGLDNGANGVAA